MLIVGDEKQVSIVTSKIHSGARITLGKKFLKIYDLKEGDTVFLYIAEVQKETDVATLLLKLIKEGKIKLTAAEKDILKDVTNKKKS